jgi:hypothetical protein
MTILRTDYSMCDQDNDLMVRSNEHEFVECTNASLKQDAQLWLKG